MPNFQVLLVKIVMASSSSSASGSATIVSQCVGVLFEKNAEKKARCSFVFQGAGLPWRDYKIAQPFGESPSPAVQKNLKKLRSSQK